MLWWLLYGNCNSNFIIDKVNNSDVQLHYYQYFWLLVSCGEGLKELYKQYQVQHFINHVPVRDLVHEKGMYQPGCLRKVQIKISFVFF